MHSVVVLWHLALWITGTWAVSPSTPSRLHKNTEVLEKHDVVARDGLDPMGFVTFKMTKTGAAARDESLSSTVSRIAHGLAKKYGSELPSRTAPKDATLVDRANTYNVVSPTPPKQSNSAGVYQDGTDYSYFVQAQLGSGATPMYMLIDTGASTTWVMGSGCTSDACNKHNTFGPEDSETLKDTNTPFSVEYGSGSVSGHVVDDTMKVAGLSVPYSFGLTNKTSDQFVSFPFDGILGLARSTGNFNDALKGAKLIDKNLFAVSIARSADGTNDGEISFGATNPAKYTGDITYTSVSGNSSWSMPMDDVSVGGKSVGVKSRDAYIDTGTTFAFCPPPDAKALYGQIPDSSSDDGVTWSFPCDTTATVAFTFSGKTYSISSKDFVAASSGDNRCTGNIFGMEVVSGAWLLGDVFLKNVYTVFDIDGSRIGFASKATGTTTSSASQSSTTSASSSTSTSDSGMGFTGGSDSSSAGGGSGTAETAAAASPTGSSEARRPDPQVWYLSIACIISILAMIA